jgi:outer membrane lipoprotein SlyB
MSGSSGGGSGGGWEPQPSPCHLLAINTQLSSPKAGVIAGLEVGEVLEVALQGGAGTSVVVLRHGQVAGGLASPDIQRLRECLESGTHFSATVREINGAQVKVSVRAVAS